MTKVGYAYIKKSDKKMNPYSVTQYWLKNDLFWYAEKYKLHNNYINTVTRYLEGVIDFKYNEKGLLKAIIERKVTSEEFSDERSIINPIHYPSESKEIEFVYDALEKLLGIEHTFRNQLNLVEKYEYSHGLLIEILGKTNHENSKTKLYYSNDFITKIELYSGSNQDPLTYRITYFSGDKKLNFTNSLDEQKDKEIKDEINVENKTEEEGITIKNKYIYYKAIVNLNLRSKPSVDSDILIMIPQDEYIFQDVENAKYTEFKDTFEINGEMITSNWIFTQYNSLKGWVFKGGIEMVGKY
jgi:hypothetical protein